MRISIPALSVAALALTACTSTGRPEDVDLGGELQVYPAGAIAGLRLESRRNEREILSARLAANVTDRRDFGEQDDEEGSGFGGGLGYRRYREDGHRGWLWGVRADVWWLDIDWEDDGPPPTSGSTDVLVLQPTAEIGYAFDLGGGRADVTLSLGAEINVDEDGEDVGDGAILLLGISLMPTSASR